MLTSPWRKWRSSRFGVTNLDRQLEMQQCIAKGGFSLVYKAFWKQKDKIVAVKCIRLKHSLYEKCCLRLGFLEKEDLPLSNREDAIQEAEVLEEIQANDFVLKFHFSQIKPREFWIVTEWCVGHFKDLLKPEPFYPRNMGRVLLYVGIAILSALSFMHKKELVHRDVKPENILFTASGVPKLADFGYNQTKSYTCANKFLSLEPSIICLQIVSLTFLGMVNLMFGPWAFYWQQQLWE